MKYFHIHCWWFYSNNNWSIDFSSFLVQYIYNDGRSHERNIIKYRPMTVQIMLNTMLNQCYGKRSSKSINIMGWQYKIITWRMKLRIQFWPAKKDERREKMKGENLRFLNIWFHFPTQRNYDLSNFQTKKCVFFGIWWCKIVFQSTWAFSNAMNTLVITIVILGSNISTWFFANGIDIKFGSG